jgi:hypothetical protein
MAGCDQHEAEKEQCSTRSSELTHTDRWPVQTHACALLLPACVLYVPEVHYLQAAQLNILRLFESSRNSGLLPSAVGSSVSNSNARNAFCHPA